MPTTTIIDILAIELGIDTSKLRKGLEEAATGVKKHREDTERHFKGMEAAANALNNVIGNLNTALRGLMAYLGAETAVKFAKFNESVASTTVTLDNFARSIGSTAPAIYPWIYAAEQLGATEGDFKSFAENWNNIISDVLMKKSDPAYDWLWDPKLKRDIGWDLFRPQHMDQQSQEQLWKSFFENTARLQKLADSGNKYAADLLQRLYTQNLIPRQMSAMAGAGMDKIADLMKQAPEYTQKQVDAARELNAHWKALMLSAESLGRTLETALVKPLEALIDSLKWIVQHIQSAIEHPTAEAAYGAGGGAAVGGAAGGFAGMASGAAVGGLVGGPVGAFIGGALGLASGFVGGAVPGALIGGGLGDWVAEKKKKGESVNPIPYLQESLGEKAEAKTTEGEIRPSKAAEGLVDVVTSGGHLLKGIDPQYATNFKGFVETLEAAGAPIKSIGAYADKFIAGTNIVSEHAKGRAIDIDQLSRNVAPLLKSWVEQHPDIWYNALKAYGLKSGEFFRGGGPDFGHIEVEKGTPPSASGWPRTFMNSIKGVNKPQDTIPPKEPEPPPENIYNELDKHSMLYPFLNMPQTASLGIVGGAVMTSNTTSHQTNIQSIAINTQQADQLNVDSIPRDISSQILTGDYAYTSNQALV
jgi:hypothetical protein